jgi:hypothetical protein
MNWFQHWHDVKARAEKGELSVEEFDQLVSNADWFYYMSDMNLSSLHMDTLQEIAEKGSDEFKRIWNRESARRFNNDSFYPDGGYEYPYPEVGLPQ